MTVSVTSNIVNPEPFLVPETEIVEGKRNRRILQHLVRELRSDVIKFNYILTQFGQILDNIFIDSGSLFKVLYEYHKAWTRNLILSYRQSYGNRQSVWHDNLGSLPAVLLYEMLRAQSTSKRTEKRKLPHLTWYIDCYIIHMRTTLNFTINSRIAKHIFFHNLLSYHSHWTTSYKNLVSFVYECAWRGSQCVKCVNRRVS